MKHQKECDTQCHPERPKGVEGYMFRRKKDYKKRSSNLVFVIFRTFLSLIIFSVLLVGIYNAFKQFSGIDIVKINLLQRDLIGLIAGLLPSSNLPPGLEKFKKQAGSNGGNSEEEKKRVIDEKAIEFKFMLVADAHNDNVNLKQALTQTPTDFVIGLGDYTDVGSVDELKAAKAVFDSVGLRYYLTPGDHDLWDSRNKQSLPSTNFGAVFGPSYQSFFYKNTRFLLLNNSDNYTGFGEAQLNWLKDESGRIKQENNSNLILAFMHEPLYHPSSTRIMGKVTDGLRVEAQNVAMMLRDLGVAEAFFGEIHYFTRYTDPDSGLPMTTVGALTGERNAQSPRYVVVSVFDDGTYEVEDVEVRTP